APNQSFYGIHFVWKCRHVTKTTYLHFNSVAGIRCIDSRGVVMNQQFSDQLLEKQRYCLRQRYKAVLGMVQFNIFAGLLISLCSLSLYVDNGHRSGNYPSTVLGYQLIPTLTTTPTPKGTPKSSPTSSPLSTSDELQ